MKPYDAKATCPKCCHSGVSTLWREADDHRWAKRGGLASQDGPDEEHMERKCARCYYEWYEAPMCGPAEPEPASDEVLRKAVSEEYARRLAG